MRWSFRGGVSEDSGTKNMQTEALQMSLFAVMLSHSLPLLALNRHLQPLIEQTRIKDTRLANVSDNLSFKSAATVLSDSLKDKLVTNRTVMEITQSGFRIFMLVYCGII